MRAERLIKDANMLYGALSKVQDWPVIRNILDWFAKRRIASNLSQDGRWRMARAYNERPWIKKLFKSKVPEPMRPIVSQFDTSGWSDANTARSSINTQLGSNPALSTLVSDLRRSHINSRAAG